MDSLLSEGQYHVALSSTNHGIQTNGTATGAAARGVLPGNDAGGLSVDLWSATIKQYVKALRIRRLTFEAGALFAGRMPMTSCFVAGGVTNSFRNQADFFARVDKFRTLIAEVGNFVVEEYVPLVLALGALYQPFDNSRANPPANGHGAGLGNFLAWGGFPAADATGTLAMPGGIWTGGVGGSKTTTLLTNAADLAAAKTEVQTHLVEVITRSRYENTFGYENSEFAYPGSVTRTEPKRSDVEKYSWMKAPRWHTAGAAGSVDFTSGNVQTVTLASAHQTNVHLAVGVKGTDYTVAFLGGTQWQITRIGTSTLVPATGAVAVASDVFTALEVGPLARMVVSGKYPMGQLLVNPAAAVGSIPRAYADLYTTGGGLDTSVISADLVAGLSNGPEGDLVPTVQGWILGTRCGLSTMDRLRARALESFWMCNYILGAYVKTVGFPTTDAASTSGWLKELRALSWDNAVDPAYVDVFPPATASGFGLVEAPRGALGHFSTQTAGKVTRYQCVVPTTWNGSPKDGPDVDNAITLRSQANNTQTKRGAIEQAMIGAPFDDRATSNGAVSGVEVLRIAQSFDPCIACAVH